MNPGASFLVEDIKDQSKEDAGHVDAEGHPPHQLLVQLLLKVLQHQQADGEAGGCPGQVGHVGHRAAVVGHRRGGVSIVDCYADVH